MTRDEMLKAALEYLPMVDLMGCGSFVDPSEFEPLNALEKAIAAEVGEDPDYYGNHSRCG